MCEQQSWAKNNDSLREPRDSGKEQPDFSDFRLEGLTQYLSNRSGDASSAVSYKNGPSGNLESVRQDGLHPPNDSQAKTQSDSAFSDGIAVKQGIETPANPGDKPQAWTMLVDLGVEIKGGGAQEIKLQQIENYREMTKDRPVTIIVQMNDGKNLHYCQIKDGQEIDLGKRQSNGIKQDLSDLVKLGIKHSPAEKIGLFVNDHGDGNGGIHSDNTTHGMCDPKDLMESLKTSLKDVGHEKLDLLDFDSCRMNQDGVLRLAASEKITDNLVGSAEIENAPGQNLGKIFANVLKEKGEDRDQTQNGWEMDGHELGLKIIKDAHENNPSEIHKGQSGADTLAYNDLTKFAAFEDKFHGFSKELCIAASNPKYGRLLDDMAERDQAYGKDASGKSFMGQRDLLQFASSVVANDHLPESLKEAAQRLIKSQKDMVTYHGEPGYEFSGGIGVFLPGASYRNELAKEQEEYQKIPAKHVPLLIGNDRAQRRNSDDDWIEFVDILQVIHDGK